MDNVQPTSEPEVEAKTSGLAIASLVLGICGFCTFGLAGIVGLILGIIGLIAIKQSAGQLKGQGLAIAGIAVSGTSLVMLLIFLLMAVLTPAIGRARGTARSVMSMNNAKQLCLAMHLYCGDYDGPFPPAGNWPEVLSDYIEDEGILNSPFNPNTGRAYAMNAQLNGRKLADVQNPALTVLVFESRFGSPPSGGPDLLPDEPRGPNGYVICFVDGHVEFIRPEKIDELIWTP